MRVGFIAVIFDPRNLGFQQSDPLCQFILRIGREVFTGQLASGVAARSWTVIFIHFESILGKALAVNVLDGYLR